MEWLDEKEKRGELLKGRKKKEGRKIESEKRKERRRGSRMDGRQEMRMEVGGGDEVERSAPRTAPCPRPCTNVLMGWNQRLLSEREPQ